MGWVLPTHNRPEKCQAVLDQIIEVGHSSYGTVLINGSNYPELRIPHNWDVEYLPENIGVCGAMQYYFKKYPSEMFYGLICDDEYVYTPGWDLTLIEACQPHHISFGNDGWQSGRRQHGYVTWSGDLVREVGFLSLPGLWHWFHDDVWESIARALDLNRFCKDVRVEHKHYRAGKSEHDATYRLGSSRRESDAKIFAEWYNNEFPELVERLKKKYVG